VRDNRDIPDFINIHSPRPSKLGRKDKDFVGLF